MNERYKYLNILTVVYWVRGYVRDFFFPLIVFVIASFFVMFSRVIHAVCVSIHYYFFFCSQMIFHILFIHSSVRRHWVCHSRRTTPLHLLKKKYYLIFFSSCQEKMLHSHLCSWVCLRVHGERGVHRWASLA